MRTVVKPFLTMTLALTCALTYAADPTTIAELKKHFESTAGDTNSFSADFTMDMDMAATGNPQAAGMGQMSMGGDIKVKGDVSKILMNMSMPAGDQTMDVKMNMRMDGKEMLMYMDMGQMAQAMKMDLTVMEGLADELGVPESALNSGNMGMGLMSNPSKMLEQYEEMYTLTLEGKETLDGEDVFVVTAMLKDDVLANFEKNPMLAGQAAMFENGQTVYLGAKDGIMRKMVMGDIMTMTVSNIDLETEVTDADLELVIPENVQVMDMTQMMQQMFSGQN